jgi:N-acetylglucosamine-6-phosphate deacetylase
VLLSAAAVVTPGGVVPGGVVAVEGGLVVDVAVAKGPVEDGVLVPGFVDLQVNGHEDVAVAEASGPDWARLDELLWAQGVTTWCPTLPSLAPGEYAPALERLGAAAARPPAGRPAIAGVHLEGPFLSPAEAGAHPVGHLRPVDRGFLASLPDVVRLVTLAPELDGAVGAVGDLTARGVLVALGHTGASAEQADAAAAAGARLVTHLFNAMAPFHHRRPGIVGQALTDDRLSVSVIADLVHVHPAAVRLAFRAKGPSGVALVTDAVAWRSAWLGRRMRREPGDAPRLPDGTLAGSALRMDEAVRNVVRAAGVALEDAVTAAASTPAALLGLADRGAIVPGRRADLVRLSADLRVRAVYVGGEPAWPG